MERSTHAGPQRARHSRYYDLTPRRERFHFLHGIDREVLRYRVESDHRVAANDIIFDRDNHLNRPTTRFTATV